MKIAAITRYKHGAIFHALSQLGWSQSELARRVGVCPPTIGHYINMRQRPSQEMADRIQRVFGDEGLYVDVLGAWPEDFKMKKAPVIVSYGEVEAHELACEGAPLSLVQADQLEIALESIPGHLRELLEDYYMHGATLLELGQRYGVTRETVRGWIRKGVSAARESYEVKVTRDESGISKDIPFVAPTCLPYERYVRPGWAQEA